MNILYLCADPGIPVRGHKGSAVHVRALSDAFVSLGHGVTIVTPRAGPVDGAATRAEIIEAVRAPLDADREQAGRAAATAVYEAARAALSKHAFDTIYERYSLWSDAGARLASEFGLPLVVEVNAPLRLEAARYRELKDEEPAARIEQRLFAAARAVAVVSEPLRAYVLKQGVPHERVHVLPNAVDEGAFHPAVDGQTVRKQLDLEDRFVLGFVGTVRPWHDLETVLDAFLRLRAEPQPNGIAFALLLVGSISAAVRDGIARRGLTDCVTIVEPVPHAEVPKYIAAMDVALSPHPALADFYYSPLKLFEYLACGRATVAADVSPIAEVVECGETALLYPPGDAATLARQVATLAADDELRAHLGWRGAESVLRRHTWRRNAQQILDWIRPTDGDLCGASASPALPLCDDVLGKALFRATRRDLAEPLLGTALAQAGMGPYAALTRVEVLKYRPRRRCVLRYEMRPLGESPAGTRPDEACRLIGKVYKDERGAQQYALHRALRANGFDAEAGDRTGVPRPLAYIPAMRMFLQAEVPGQTLDAFASDPDFADRCRSAARAIASLHGSRVSPSKHHALADEAAVLTQWHRTLVRHRPAAESRFDHYRDALMRTAASLPSEATAPAHRDFYYTQVLFARESPYLIDLDLFAWADPTLDVANFAAHLRFLSLQRSGDANALDSARAAFVEAYARCAEPAEGFERRMAFYERATYFRLLGICADRHEYNGYFDAMEVLLGRELGGRAQPAT